MKLDLLLEAFGDAGIIINAKKTSLFEDKVDYFGFELSKDGIGTVKSYTVALQEYLLQQQYLKAKACWENVPITRSSLKDSVKSPDQLLIQISHSYIIITRFFYNVISISL